MIAVTVLACGCRILPQAAAPGWAESDAVTLAYLARLQAESGAPSVSAAVAVNGRIAFSGGVGLSDIESEARQNGRSVHNIGSISKTQSVVAVMQLVERGRINLDAEIQTYVPWFPRKPQPITARNVLTHTSGLRHYREGEFGPGNVMAFRHYDSYEESTRYWRDDPLVCRPGTHYVYSSYATGLMHAIVESVSGEPFEHYLSEHVWRPAGMLDTQFDVPARIVARRGRGYVRNERTGQLENAEAEDVSYKYAAGGMISTDEDLVRFGHALNVGLLLRPQTIAELYRLQLPPDIPYLPEELAELASHHLGEAVPSMGGAQGLIFVNGQGAGGHRYVGHSGSVKGTVSRLSNYYDDDVVVALHFNYNNGHAARDEGADAADALARLYLTQKSR